ncbi:hypothetical protein AnigIFM56816_011101 [Aspergillus niger]|nr:hypothetical protein AnigIFM56816_011101 [Aspergillus niger]
MNKPRVGIIGVGHAGCALAVDFESRNVKAILWAAPGHRRVYDRLAEQGHLDATEAITGRFYPSLTQELADVLQATRVILIAVPSTAHDEIIATLAQYNLSQHVVIFITGNFIASIAAARLQAKAVMTTSRAPYSSRTQLNDAGEVQIRINGIKKRLEIARFGGPVDQRTRHYLGLLFSMPLVWYTNTLQLDLSTNHGVVHPPTMLCNIGPIRRQETDLFFYRDCMTPEVCDLMLAADRERLQVAAALGFTEMESVLEMFNADYGAQCSDLATFVASNAQLNKRPGLPGSMLARQVSQDIPFWCVPVASLGEALGVPTPIISGWILSCSTLNKTDYRAVGRTLSSFSLPEGASKEEILLAFNALDDEEKGIGSLQSQGFALTASL